MPQTQDMTPHPVTVYRHRPDLPLCYPLMWNITLEYTTTHFNVLGQTRSGNPSPTLHTHQRTLNYMMLIWWLSVTSLVESVPYPPDLEFRHMWCANPLHFLLAHSCFCANFGHITFEHDDTQKRNKAKLFQIKSLLHLVCVFHIHHWGTNSLPKQAHNQEQLLELNMAWQQHLKNYKKNPNYLYS